VYWQAGVNAARKEYELLVNRQGLDPTCRFWSQFLMEDLEAGLDTLTEFADGSNDAPRIRAVLRWMLPQHIVERVEAHPRFSRLMLDRGLTTQWRKELITLANGVVGLTGIRVEDERDTASIDRRTLTAG